MPRASPGRAGRMVISSIARIVPVFAGRGESHVIRTLYLLVLGSYRWIGSAIVPSDYFVTSDAPMNVPTDASIEPADG